MDINPRNAVFLDHKPTRSEFQHLAAEQDKIKPHDNPDGTPGKWMFWWPGIEADNPYETEN